MGYLLLLDGIGLDDIGFDCLEQWLVLEKISELIFVINLMVEGEVIVNYIVELCVEVGVEVSCIVYGVLVGGELEMVDGMMLFYLLVGCYKIIF